MIREALRAAAIGLPGVFAVLGVFYVTLRLMLMRRRGRGDE